MSNTDMKRIYQAVRRYARTVGNISEDAELLEVCDFGNSYGFLLDSGDKYANLYWCVEKETYKLYSFRPNMDMKKFINRKILQKEIVE